MITRGHRLFTHLLESIEDMTSKIHVQAAKIIALLTLLSAHWIGCLFFFMSRLRGLDRRTWVSSIEDTLRSYERFSSPIYFQYLLALFKGFSSISGVEFTSYLANNAEEQVAGLLMIIVEVYISALILGTIIHFFALKDPRAQQTAERHRELQQFVQFHQIPPELETKLSQGLDFQMRKMAADNADAEFELSRSLEIKVAKAKYSNLIQRCSAKGRLFQDCSERFLDEILVLCSAKYFMASQEILQKGDISRELIFLIDGAVECVVDPGPGGLGGGTEGHNPSGGASEVISSEVPDHCPCVGEVAFFLGIMQPWTVRAHKRSDVRVAALAREDSEALFKRFPDQQELIRRNILWAFNLGADGSYISGRKDEKVDRDPHYGKVRDELHAAILRRREESFASLVFAAKHGDLDVVRMMLAGGMELHRDYDGRTVLAHAATAGIYKVCDVLLEEKADINAVNRWGQTPLDEAIAANQGSIIQLLSQRHARMGPGIVATAIIEAASKGDADKLARILRDNQGDPDARDYDKRTPLHLACINGHMKAVELLLACKATINSRNRWGGTPLEDAITSRHASIAYLLWNKGAQMDRDSGIAKLCEAAGRGNMVALRMLRTCRVVDLDSKDYDGRTAVMVAASEGRVLATSYLLSCSCSPDELDGWGASALDRALQGGTLYHMYCAKLLQSWGGKVSLLQGTPDGEQALAELDKIDIADVRHKLKYLIAQGHDQAVPKAMTEYEIRFAFESCTALIPLVETVRSKLEEPSRHCDSVTNMLREFGGRLHDLAHPVCQLLDALPVLQKRKLASGDQNFASNEAYSSSRKLSSALSSLFETNHMDPPALIIHERRKQVFLVRKLKKTIALALEDGLIEQSEEEEINEVWDALAAADQDKLFVDVDELDSDEEAQLHADVDFMIAEREYCEDHSLDRTLYQASKFQGTALRIGEMEEMYETLCSIFCALKLDTEVSENEGRGNADTDFVEPLISKENLGSFFSALAVHTLQEMKNCDVDEMFEEASLWLKEIQFDVSHVVTRDREANLCQYLYHTHSCTSTSDKDLKIPLRILCAGSSLFRHALLNAPINEILCLIQQKTKIPEIVPESILRMLVAGGSVINACKGQVLLNVDGNIPTSISSSIHGFELRSSWFAVISGSLSVVSKCELNTSDDPNTTEQEEGSCLIFSAGQIFGAYAFLGGKTLFPYTIKARTACRLVQLPLLHLEALSRDNPEVATELKRRMAERSVFRNALPATKLEGSSFSQWQSLEFANSLKCIAGYELSPNQICSRANAHSFSVRGARKSKPWDETQAAYIGVKIGQGSMSDFYIIQCGMRHIEESWQYLSGGSSHISRQVLHSIHSELGEIGAGTFAKLFLSSRDEDSNKDLEDDTLQRLHDLNPSEFWGLWIALLADKGLKSHELKKMSSQFEPINAIECLTTGFRLPEQSPYNNSFGSTLVDSCISDAEDDSNTHNSSKGKEMDMGIFEGLHSRLASSRRLTKFFLMANLIESGQYEQAYLSVVGDLNSPLHIQDVPEFLRLLFPTYKYKISSLNCTEFVRTFGKDGNENSINWPDIRRVLRVKAPSEEEQMNIFIMGRLNPNSILSTRLMQLARLIAAYHFLSIPWRISSVGPSDSMTDALSLSIFVPADALTVLYVFARLNTAHQSGQRNIWVTNHWDIYRKIGNSCIIAALPIDWIIFSVGGSYQTCLWFRLLKLLLCYDSFCQSRTTSAVSNPLMLIVPFVAGMHVCCCLWYYVGIHYKSWDLVHPFSWFKIGYPLNDPRYIPDTAEDGNSYEYHGLSCNETKTAVCNPGETWYYYGMWYTDSDAARYLLSLWVVCGRVADQSLLGDIVPQNFVEVVFSIGLMMMNLTVFRYVIGELSATVMSFNEQLVAARDRAEKVLNFIKTNRLPEDLVNEIKTYCSSSSSSGASVLKSSRVLRYLPHMLQVEVARHVCGDLLDGVCLFRGCSDYFKDFLIVSMSTAMYSPDEYIFRLGEVATDMYVVQNGSVEELVQVEDASTLRGEKPMAVARSGQALGALALFFELRHMYSARVSRTSGVTCLRLSRERFLQLLKYCPQEEERITENAMQSFQKKFGNMSTSKAGSSISARGDLESDGESLHTGPSTKAKGTDTDHSSSGIKGVGKQARSSISHIKSRRRALRTHMLLSAARYNNLERTEWALQGGHIGVDSCDDMGRSALHVAASEGHVEMVEYLLVKGANPCISDRHGNSPLNDAVRHRHDAVAAAIRTRAPDGKISLHGLSSGIQMCTAAAEGDLVQIQRLLANGVSPQAVDYDSRTALHIAACYGRLEVTKYLISSRADVQAKDRLGNSPLDDAIQYGHKQVQLALRAAGARVGWMRNGLRACRASAAGDEGSVRLVRALMDMGLDPAACDHYDRTPLHLAACSGGLSLLEFLLGLAKNRETNAESNSQIHPDISPADIACEPNLGHESAQILAHKAVVLHTSRQYPSSESRQNPSLDIQTNQFEESVRTCHPGDHCVVDDQLKVGFVNALDRFGFTPLDDAKRSGNAVAALALKRAGGLESGDLRMAPHLADAKNARARWWQHARKQTIAEVVGRSSETDVWRLTETKALPLLKSVLERIESGHRDLEKLLADALQSLSLVLIKLIDSDDMKSELCKPEARSTALEIKMKVMNLCRSGKDQSDQKAHSSEIYEDSCSATISDLEDSITGALNRIAIFFSRDMEEAQEATSLEFLLRGKYLQPSCAGISRSLQALRSQLRHTCRTLRLIRRILNSFSSFRLAAAIRKASRDSKIFKDIPDQRIVLQVEGGVSLGHQAEDMVIMASPANLLQH